MQTPNETGRTLDTAVDDAVAVAVAVAGACFPAHIVSATANTSHRVLHIQLEHTCTKTTQNIWHAETLTNTQDGDGRLGGEAERLDLADGRFHYPAREVIAHLPLHKLQPVVPVLRLERVHAPYSTGWRMERDERSATQACVLFSATPRSLCERPTGLFRATNT